MFEIKKINLDEYDFFYDHLSNHFPDSERKSRESELKTFSNEIFKPNFIYFNEKIVGYLCYWELDEFCFIEHFAILEEYRNKGIGTSFLKHFIQNKNKNIILEVDIPNANDFKNIALRRINFYKRIGFKVNEYEYYQPSFGDGFPQIAMYICSYPNQIDSSEFLNIQNLIYRFIYEIKIKL
jgi:ribosomal protein S18 acetylase RimI-like enzyme